MGAEYSSAVLLLLLACGDHRPEDRDRELHARALTAGKDAECSGIQDTALRGDCESWRAGQLALSDSAAAESACDEISAALWREECWFLLSDNTEAIGERAERLCGHTGRFQTQCRSHAIGREAVRWLSTPGQEDQAMAGLEAHFLKSYPPERAYHEAQRALTSELLRRPRPFTPATFGHASDEIVVFTLAEHLRFSDCSRKQFASTLDPELVARAVADAGC